MDPCKASVPGAVEAARIVSLAADGRTSEAWEAIDEAIRGDNARETMMVLAVYAAVALRLTADRCGITVEQALLLGPAGEYR